MQRYGGISRYYAEIISDYNKTKEMEFELSLFTSNNDNLSLLPFIRQRNLLGDKTFTGKGLIERTLNNLNTLNAIRKRKFDVFHSTFYDPYFLSHLGSKPFVLTVYDTIHEKFGSAYPELNNDKPFIVNKSLLLNAAAKIIAISNSTKKDLIDIYGLDPEKIDVVHLASSTNSETGQNLVPLNFNTGDRYLLFVGNRVQYKNFEFMLTSIIPLLLKDRSLKLICAGGPPFTPEEQYKFKENNLSASIIYQKINDQTLNYLYSNAIAFIFPSLYEGFGIPVLEAMNNSCPCILSTGGSLTEVAEEAAIYFDPVNSVSILAAVEKVVYDTELRERLAKAGKFRSTEFSWRKTSRLTLEIYKNIPDAL